MHEVFSRLSSILTLPITSPVNEVFESATKDFRVSNVVHFILLFAFNGDRVRRWWH
jgi:hypothetical protein